MLKLKAKQHLNIEYFLQFDKLLKPILNNTLTNEHNERKNPFNYTDIIWKDITSEAIVVLITVTTV